MYKSMGAQHSYWQLSRNNQYVSYALLSWAGSIHIGDELNVYEACHALWCMIIVERLLTIIKDMP